MNLYQLQNGSDIRGVAMEGVEGEPVTLTKEIVAKFAAGFAYYVKEKTKKQQVVISVGHDSRLSAPMLKEAIISALCEQGCIVYDCGLASTPSMFMSTIFQDFLCDGAIMITASHLPFHRNGMKFFDKDGGLNKEDITKVIDYAHMELKADGKGSVEKKDLISVYSAHLRELIKTKVRSSEDYERPLKGLHIIVDAGNGAGGFYASQVLEPLGANVEGSQFLDPDGNFPNHIPNPEDKEAMHSISCAVKQHHADLGIIFDTDVDRSSAVDQYGKEISRNAIVAMAAALLKEEFPHTTIVTDSVTSDELHEFLEEELQMHHLRFKRGYKNVINEAIRLNANGVDCQLAIETSGHAAFKENYFLDDGAYLATKMVIKAALMKKEGATLDTCIQALKYPFEAYELRFTIQANDFSAYGDQVLNDLKHYCENHTEFHLAKENYEGLRISFDQEHGGGWCLLRKSLHDPILPFNLESTKEGGCKMIAAQLYPFLKQYEELDLQAMEAFLKEA